MTLQGVEPFGFATEDETLEDGCLDLRGRALQITHDELCGTKYGVDTIRKQMIDSVMFYHLTHTTV